MSQKVYTPIHAGNPAKPDLLVVGAGVFGLWAARHGLKRGERVLVVEKRNVGAGASGGFLGALMPHMPDRWNAKKQLQYDGLRTLKAAIAELEADTGHDCGYRRCGRLMPLRHGKMLDHLKERIAGATQNWVDGAGGQAFTLEHVGAGELAERFAGPDGKPWLSPGIAIHGAQFDTLSARVNPRAYLAALATYVRRHEKGAIVEDAEVAGVDPASISVTLADGAVLSAGRIVIANGWETYDLLAGLDARTGQQQITGRGVKGQAVLLDLPHGDDLPVLYDSGSYIVPHGSRMGMDITGTANRLAVGSTSVDDWQSGPGDTDTGKTTSEMAATREAARTGFDTNDMAFLEHARALCPAIASAAVAEQWANVRPRNTIPDPRTGKIGTEPVFGAVKGCDQISVAAGGFKISFAIAHLPH